MLFLYLEVQYNIEITCLYYLPRYISVIFFMITSSSKTKVADSSRRSNALLILERFRMDSFIRTDNKIDNVFRICVLRLLNICCSHTLMSEVRNYI